MILEQIDDRSGVNQEKGVLQQALEATGSIRPSAAAAGSPVWMTRILVYARSEPIEVRAGILGLVGALNAVACERIQSEARDRSGETSVLQMRYHNRRAETS